MIFWPHQEIWFQQLKWILPIIFSTFNRASFYCMFFIELLIIIYFYKTYIMVPRHFVWFWIWSYMAFKINVICFFYVIWIQRWAHLQCNNWHICNERAFFFLVSLIINYSAFKREKLLLYEQESFFFSTYRWKCR